MAKLKIGSVQGGIPKASEIPQAPAGEAAPAQELVRQEIVAALEDPNRGPDAGEVRFNIHDATPGNQALAFLDGYELPKWPNDKDAHLYRPVEGVDLRDPISIIRYTAQHGLVHPELDQAQSSRAQKSLGNRLATAINQGSPITTLLTNLSQALEFDGEAFTGRIKELYVYTVPSREQLARQSARESGVKIESRLSILGQRLKALIPLSKKNQEADTEVDEVQTIRRTAMFLASEGFQVYADAEKKVFVLQLKNAENRNLGFARLEFAPFNPDKDHYHFITQRNATNSRRMTTTGLSNEDYNFTAKGLELQSPSGKTLVSRI